MKKFIYMLVAALAMFTGCEYHPYYDGQDFCLYFGRTGLIEADGEHISVPIVSKTPFTIECYGGLGENYSFEIDDPRILGYTFVEKEAGGVSYDVPEPASFVLEPKELGETSVTVTDKDTGESIQFYVHVVEAYQAIEITEENKFFEYGTQLIFRYGGSDNVLKVLMHIEGSYEYEVVAEGTYEFVVIDELLYLEMMIPLDGNGTFSPSGEPAFKRFQIQLPYEGAYDYMSMQSMMNLEDYPLSTKAIRDEYYTGIWYVDVTGLENLEVVSADEHDYFAGSNPQLFVWD